MAQYRYNFYVLSDEEDRGTAVKILYYLEEQTTHMNHQLRGYHDDRDGEYGKLIISSAGNAIKESEFILVLVSRQAIASGWWEMKAHMALKHRLDNPHLKDTVIPVYLPGLPLDERPLPLQIIEGVEYEDNSDSDFWRQLKNIFN